MSRPSPTLLRPHRGPARTHRVRNQSSSAGPVRWQVASRAASSPKPTTAVFMHVHTATTPRMTSLPRISPSSSRVATYEHRAAAMAALSSAAFVPKSSTSEAGGVELAGGEGPGNGGRGQCRPRGVMCVDARGRGGSGERRQGARVGRGTSTLTTTNGGDVPTARRFSPARPVEV